MNRVARLVSLMVGLGAGSITACDHGSCVLSGMPECSSMNQAGCARTPHCRWDKACAVVTPCYGANEAACNALDYCYYRADVGSCEFASDPCRSLSLETCGTDPRCGLAPGCVGKPVSCDSYDDSDSCEQDLHCDWYSTPAL
ncbi:MAG TPA: hypothetical protein VGQ57_00525 [Polyangiaceae bacterium]|nr:hypothetical protein [Polyangiaceae bacterium]